MESGEESVACGDFSVHMAQLSQRAVLSRRFLMTGTTVEESLAAVLRLSAVALLALALILVSSFAFAQSTPDGPSQSPLNRTEVVVPNEPSQTPADSEIGR